MKRTVVYRGLWLLSERDKSGRLIQFHEKRNLFAGENETGKSRILKHIVWALGGEPAARDAGNWDVNVVAALGISVDGKEFVFMRRGLHERAVFDANGELVVGTERASTFAETFASIFDYPLKLQRHQEGAFGLAGPEYALLPHYIDQEGGWTKKWASFTRLAQFARWEAMVFESFTGLRPSRYFEAQLTLDDLAFQLREARAQVRVQEKSYLQVKAMLPTSAAKLDESLFAKELKELSDKVVALGQEESRVRADLFEVAQKLQERTSELQIVLQAEQDLVDDLAYLSKIPDDASLACPTCGQDHGVTFPARFALASDANDAHLLVLKVREQLEKLKSKEAKLRVQLKGVSTQMEDLRLLMEKREGESSISDVVSARSLDTIAHAYGKAHLELKTAIDDLEENHEALKEEIALLTDAARVKEVRQTYRDALRSYTSHLRIDNTELKGIAIGARPKMGSGSSGPRIFLATHMALLETNDKYGDGPRFPFIVDTPRQQDLDPNNAAKLLQTIADKTKTHQLFIANGDVPEGWDETEDCEAFVFDTKRKVLLESEYQLGVELLSPFVQMMQDAIRIERENAAREGIEQQAEEVATVLPEEEDADDE